MSMLFFYERIEIFIRMIEKLSLIRPGCYNIVMQVKGVLNMPENLQLVIITGMSGAGKTVAGRKNAVRTPACPARPAFSL